jgi:hypothetical protein
LKKARKTGSLPAVKYTLLQANMFVEDMASKQSLGLFFRPAVPKLDTLFQFMCTRRSEALKAALQTKVLGFVSCRLSLTPPPLTPCSLVFMYLEMRWYPSNTFCRYRLACVLCTEHSTLNTLLEASVYVALWLIVLSFAFFSFWHCKRWRQVVGSFDSQ